jgi:hypothetical protein
MVLTVSFVLSPVTGLFCHRHPADNSARLDASVGASGPHDFAVRISILRPALACLTLPRPSHPAPNVRDDRETPLCVGRDRGGYRFDLGRRRSGIFFAEGLDRNLVICPSGKITLNLYGIGYFEAHQIACRVDQFDIR